MAAELDAHGLLAGPTNPAPRRPTYADLAALPYLDAVLRESLRIMPVSVFMYRETVDPVTDIGSYAVPANTEVMVRAVVRGRVSRFFHSLKGLAYGSMCVVGRAARCGAGQAQCVSIRCAAYVSKGFFVGASHVLATPGASYLGTPSVSWVWGTKVLFDSGQHRACVCTGSQKGVQSGTRRW